MSERQQADPASPETCARRVVHADVPVTRSPSGLPIQHLISERTGATDLFVARQWLEPGDRVFLHTHPVEEALVFLAGAGEATLGEEVVAIGPGVSLYVPPGLPHGFRCLSGTLHVLIAFPGGSFAETTMVDEAASRQDGKAARRGGMGTMMASVGEAALVDSASDARSAKLAASPPRRLADSSSVLAEATRGGIVESVHHGVVAVVDVDGRLVAAAGDPERVVFFRSSAKPFQAIPVVESGAADRFGFTAAELALCCASHNAEPRHQEQVAAMLAKLGLGSDALRCGIVLPADPAEAARVELGLRARSPLQCDCSGKHAGMLAACLRLGLPIERYLEPEHPLQRWILRIMAEVLRVPEAEIVPGTDGCSLPTFGAPLRAFATAYAALADPERAPAGAGREHAASLLRLRAAMVSHPENVAGAGELVTDLMALSGGRIVAKSGAEGLTCLALPERGLGVAIRILDGSFRAHAVVVAETLRQLGAGEPALIEAILARHPPALRNHNGRHVGDLRAAFALA